MDTKTVERWIAETRTPHRSNRQRVALAVGADEAYLWPDAFSDNATRAASLAEVAGIYPNRGSIPSAVWHSMFTQAAESIDILAFAASFLHDTLADFDEILAAKARQGVRVRLVFGDPTSHAVPCAAKRRVSADSLAERCRLTWKYLQPLIGVPGLRADPTHPRCTARSSASTMTFSPTITSMAPRPTTPPCCIFAGSLAVGCSTTTTGPSSGSGRRPTPATSAMLA